MTPREPNEIRDLGYREKWWLIEHYCNRKLNAMKIAEICGVTETIIHKWIRFHNVRRNYKPRR